MLDGLTQLAATVANIDTTGSTGIDWTRYVMACIGLASVMALATLGLKKLNRGSWQNRATRRSLRVVDALSIGRKQRMVVVSCYDRTFVLGVGEREVALVAELDSDPAATAPNPAPAPAASPAPTGRFSELLARIGAELGPEATTAAAARVQARGGARRAAPAPAADPVEAERRAQREVVRRAAARANGQQVVRPAHAAPAGPRARSVESAPAVRPDTGQRGAATVADALRDGGLLG